MPTFNPGLVHTPVTPFLPDRSIDYDTYARVLDFHLAHGADALALPMPQGEDMSLTDVELRELTAFAIKRVGGRVPVLAHVSDAGTAIAVERAQEAAGLGASAIVSHPPYFWHPKPAMVIEHCVQIGTAVKLPFYVVQPPVESVGTTLSTEIVLELIGRVPHLAGVVDCSLDFVFMEEIMTNGRPLRPGLQLLAGADFMVPSGALGGTGAFSPLSSIAPRATRALFELCRQEKFMEARDVQEQLAALNHAIKAVGESGLRDGLAGIKVALQAFGRDCGAPRPPVRAATDGARARLGAALDGMAFLKSEPRGW